MPKTIESAFTRDYPDADCYVDAANGRGQTGKPFCSCASDHCAKRERECAAGCGYVPIGLKPPGWTCGVCAERLRQIGGVAR